MLGPWQIRHGYTSFKMNGIVPRLHPIQDRKWLELKGPSSGSASYHVDASATVVITSKHCHLRHVVEPFTIFAQQLKKTARSRPTVTREPMMFAWGRACMDEAHQEVSGFGTAHWIFKQLGKHVRKWLLTGTPFETSPEQMANWIATLEDGWASSLLIPQKPWPRRDRYRQQPRECTFAKIKELGAMHKRLVKGTDDSGLLMPEHVRKLSIVLNTIWLRRSATRSKFFDQPLTNVLPNIHHDVECILPPEFLEVVNSEVLTITSVLQKELDQATAKWEATVPRLTPKPQLNMNNWLLRARRMRILSSFPRLGTLDKTRRLSYTGKEDRNADNGWIKPVGGRLYELQRTNSPYEVFIRDVCAPANCPKSAALNQLMDEAWEPGEKACFATMGPTNALLLYWVSDYPGGRTLPTPPPSLGPSRGASLMMCSIFASCARLMWRSFMAQSKSREPRTMSGSFKKTRSP